MASPNNAPFRSKAAESSSPAMQKGYRPQHKFSRGPKEMSMVHKQLVADGILKVGLGAELCFYMNKLDFTQIEELAKALDKPADKFKQANLNWFNIISYSESGKNPSGELSTAISTYKGFADPDQSNRLNIYGAVDVKVDFSKIDLVTTPDGAVKYPYGILFFSDSRHSDDRYSAVVSCAQCREPRGKYDRNKYDRNKYVNPIGDYTNAHCKGIFRSFGNFVIFYVDHEIEKSKGQYHPEVTLVEIEVGLNRGGPWGVIDRTFVSETRKVSSCVPDDLDFLANRVFSHYEVQEPAFASEFIYMVGGNPVDYNYAPAHNQEGAEYYGSRVVHSAKNNGRNHQSAQKIQKKDNLFRYIDHVERASSDTTVVPAQKKAGKKPAPVPAPVSAATVVKEESTSVATPAPAAEVSAKKPKAGGKKKPAAPAKEVATVESSSEPAPAEVPAEASAMTAEEITDTLAAASAQA